MITIVSDLFLTDSFLIKGEVERKYAALVRDLQNEQAKFAEVRQKE